MGSLREGGGEGGGGGAATPIVLVTTVQGDPEYESCLTDLRDKFKHALRPRKQAAALDNHLRNELTVPTWSNAVLAKVRSMTGSVRFPLCSMLAGCFAEVPFPAAIAMFAGPRSACRVSDAVCWVHQPLVHLPGAVLFAQYWD